MSLYVYAPILYPDLKEFIAEIGAKRLVRHDGLHFVNKGTPVDLGGGDAVVCWGGMVPAIPNVAMLNTSRVYRNMLDLNRRGLVNMSNKGFNTFVLHPLKSPQYEENLAKLKDTWWPAAKNGTLIATPEFQNFALQYYQFTSVGKSLVFKGNTITGQTVPYLVDYLQAMEVDFAEVYYGYGQGTTFVLKVITAPVLDTNNRKQLGAIIKQWATEMGAL